MDWWAWLLIVVAAVLIVFGVTMGHDINRYLRMRRM